MKKIMQHLDLQGQIMSSSFLYVHAKEYLQLKWQFWTGWVHVQ